ncbi:MAG: phytanoyl-CoA dioxygenase family protein [Cocleimonas sp.]|nr:phytanoyl-CoA dioxygenase family protein [Cocleimonas sp.]
MNNFLVNLSKTPFWLFELLTTAKSFKGNPIIGSAMLNRLGLHVVRLVISHGIMRARMWMLAVPISRQDRQFYFREGYLIKENFLSDEDFNALEKEAKSFNGDIREARQGDTITLRAALSPDVLESIPAIDSLINNKQFKQLAHFTAGHLREPFYYLEKVKNGYNSNNNGAPDPQKNLHSDTFHPTMKCWFFIDDVKEEAGPFMYVPGSQRLTWKNLKWQYYMSIGARDAKNTLHGKGSSRYDAKDLDVLGLPPAKAFAVKKNTLIFANTFGIHRRGDSAQKSTRLALWGDSRTNPFIPLPGLGGEAINKIQYYFLDLYRKKADENAAKRGGLSPWKLLKNNETSIEDR